ncbi:MAG: hypothetical protein ABL307_09400 [Roseitalea porphyridii]|uniref:hypothetical protein n=1 Tax=Roseitalea porphyridii TaxID=1852022 RepID=UPI0032D8C61A
MVAAFLVEGRCEQRIIQRLCPGVKVALLETNGNSVSLEAIATRIAAFFRLLNNKYYPLCVVFDRESRGETVPEIQGAVLEILERDGIPIDQIRVGVADRKFETWLIYLIDSNGNLRPNCDACSVDEFEGAAGVGELERRLRQSGKRYHKTTIGVDLFCSADLNRLAVVSSSFRIVRENLPGECNL